MNLRYLTDSGGGCSHRTRALAGGNLVGRTNQAGDARWLPMLPSWMGDLSQTVAVAWLECVHRVCLCAECRT